MEAWEREQRGGGQRGRGRERGKEGKERERSRGECVCACERERDCFHCIGSPNPVWTEWVCWSQSTSRS